MSTTARLVRTRGIEAPYNKDQIGSCVLHPIILVGFAVLCALTFTSRRLGIVLAPFVPLNALVAGFWGYVSWTNPAAEGGLCTFRRKGHDTLHYCSFCRKTVKGFDHHCSWLNTCISSRNYIHFYLLAVSGSLLYGYMVATAMLVQFLVDEDDLAEGFGGVPGARWCWGVFAAVSGWVAFSFLALAGFHSYLLCLGLGTFDWVVLQGQKRAEKLANRRRTHGTEKRNWMQCSCCSINRRRRARHAAVQDVAGVSAPRSASGAGLEREAVAEERRVQATPGNSSGGLEMGAGAVTPLASRQASEKRLVSSELSNSPSVNGSSKRVSSKPALP